MPENATDFLPFFGTDIGWCSLVKPQAGINSKAAAAAASCPIYGLRSSQFRSPIFFPVRTRWIGLG